MRLSWLAVHWILLAPLSLGAQTPPAVPHVIAAGIEEPDVEFGRPVGRSVRLWIDVADLPECPAPVELGFLIDADRDASTSRVPGPLDLGPDARVHAVCGPGGWTSPVGEVRVGSGEEGARRLTIETVVERLPSSSFRWVVYARSGDRAEILPAGGTSGPC